MASETDKLLENIRQTEQGISAPGLDINNLMLPDSEVVKNLILMRNPNMDKSDADLMVDGLTDSGRSSSSIIEMNQLSQEADTPYKRKLIDDNVEDTKNNLNRTGIPIPESDYLYEEARLEKRTFSESVSRFIRKVLELLKDISFASIALSQTIAGSIQLVVTPSFPMPSFNIPGMITMLMNVIMTLSSLNSKYQDVKSSYIYFSRINVVCSEENSNVVAGVLNNMNNKLNTDVYSFTKKIDSFVGQSSSAMKETLDPSNEGKRERTITRQLRKLNYLPNNNFRSVDEDDIDSVNDILEDWKVINMFSKTKAVTRKEESKKKLQDLLNSINKLDSVNDDLKSLVSTPTSEEKSDKTVYDVEFPDGNIVKGLSREEIEGYKKIYHVIYSPNVKFLKN